jgi:acetyl-CoA carboxylase biotin carboxylase subunit
MRKRMIRGAVKMFSRLGYRGAGTIEGLVEGNNFYFMEVNARVQVEHPVSELVSGMDIIRQQILACTGTGIEAGNIRLEGWALECRINALGPGTINRLEVPGGPGVRFDSFLYQGYTVSPHYDSMAAKLIVHAPNRERAIRRMERALGELVIQGIATNREQQLRIIKDPVFRSGNFGTAYYQSIEKELEHAR